jgi:hypothetical protein
VEAGVHEVRQHEVDEPVVTAERDGGFGPVGGKRPQPFPLAAGEHDPEYVRLLALHVLTLTARPPARLP